METRPDQRVVPALGEDRRSRPGSTFDLMDSKLRSPPARPGIVARTALVERLLASPAPVICVVAPPGYGKTTLLAQWSGRLGTQVGWVSVDRRDNDPVVLLTYIAAALDRIEPVDPEVFQALASPGVSVAGTALPRVVAAVSTITRPVTLVLDHVELLENPECLDTVDELAVDAREARAPLEAADAAPSDAEAAKLIARTEGWPVGLYLAALARRAAGGRRSITGYRFSGDDRFIADYLHSELLARLPAELVSFLTRAAVLERMCGPLCDAVLDATGSGEVLASLEESNLLVVPLDRTALHRGDLVAARGQLARAARLRPLLTHAIPWLAVQTLLELGRAYLTLDDLAGARAVLRQAGDIRQLRPNLGTLPAEVQELRSSLDTARRAITGASSLTTAELRLLLLLAPPHPSRDRPAAVPLAQHGQDPRHLHLPKARGQLAWPGGPAGTGDRPPHHVAPRTHPAARDG